MTEEEFLAYALRRMNGGVLTDEAGAALRCVARSVPEAWRERALVEPDPRSGNPCLRWYADDEQGFRRLTILILPDGRISADRASERHEHAAVASLAGMLSWLDARERDAVRAALEECLRDLPEDVVWTACLCGPISAARMLEMISAGDPHAQDYMDAVIGVAVHQIRLRAKRLMKNADQKAE